MNTESTPTLYEHLNQHPAIANGDVIADIWTIYDVLEMRDRDEQPYPLSKRAARQILANVKKHSTTEYGITWASVEDAIDQHLHYNPPKVLRGRVAVAIANNPDGGMYFTEEFTLPAHTFEDHTTKENILEDNTLSLIIATKFEALASDKHPDALFVQALTWELEPANEPANRT